MLLCPWNCVILARDVNLVTLTWVTLRVTVLSLRDPTILLGKGRLLRLSQVALLVYELAVFINGVRGTDLRLCILAHTLEMADPLTEATLCI